MTKKNCPNCNLKMKEIKEGPKRYYCKNCKSYFLYIYHSELRGENK